MINYRLIENYFIGQGKNRRNIKNGALSYVLEYQSRKESEYLLRRYNL